MPSSLSRNHSGCCVPLKGHARANMAITANATDANVRRAYLQPLSYTLAKYAAASSGPIMRDWGLVMIATP